MIYLAIYLQQNNTTVFRRYVICAIIPLCICILCPARGTIFPHIALLRSKRVICNISSRPKGGRYILYTEGIIAYNTHCKQGESNTNPPSSFSTQFDILHNSNKVSQLNNKTITLREVQLNQWQLVKYVP